MSQTFEHHRDSVIGLYNKSTDIPLMIDYHPTNCKLLLEGLDIKWSRMDEDLRTSLRIALSYKDYEQARLISKCDLRNCTIDVAIITPHDIVKNLVENARSINLIDNWECKTLEDAINIVNNSRILNRNISLGLSILDSY